MLNRDRKGVGSIPARGPIVDEFFSTVPGCFFDMCMIQFELKNIYPSEFIELAPRLSSSLNHRPLSQEKKLFNHEFLCTSF